MELIQNDPAARAWLTDAELKTLLGSKSIFDATFAEFSAACHRMHRLNLFFGDRSTEFLAFYEDVCAWYQAGYSMVTIANYFDAFRRKHACFSRKFTDMDQSLFATVTASQTIAHHPSAAAENPPPPPREQSRQNYRHFLALRKSDRRPQP